jgi:hypothetical protein
MVTPGESPEPFNPRKVPDERLSSLAMNRWPDVEATRRLRAAVEDLAEVVKAAGDRAERSTTRLVRLTWVLVLFTLALVALTVVLLVQR